MTLPLFVMGAAIAVSVAYGAFIFKAPSNIRSTVKTIPVVLFALTALLAGAPVLLAIGMALSAIGDWFLSRTGESAFLAGLGTFLTGHIAYIILFWGGSSDLSLSAGLAIFAIAYGAFLWPRAGDFRWPVLAYIAVILTMVITASGLGDDHKLALYGAFFFLASDSVLALDMFAMKPDSPRHKITVPVVWVTYICAQTLILLAYIG